MYHLLPDTQIYVQRDRNINKADIEVHLDMDRDMGSGKEIHKNRNVDTDQYVRLGGTTPKCYHTFSQQ